MMLERPLQEALRTTSNHLKRLREIDIHTVGDLLRYFPRTHEDQRTLRRIIEIRADEKNTVSGRIERLNVRPTRSGKKIVSAILSDETGTIEINWFNQPHLKEILRPGTNVIVSGKAKWIRQKGNAGQLVLQSPVYEISKPELVHTARLVPVYHETALLNGVRGRISSKWLREKLHPLLPYAEYFEEFLPEDMLKEESLIALPQAIANIHFPESPKLLMQAKERLAFNELFLLQLAALRRRVEWRKAARGKRKPIPIDFDAIRTFLTTLPFTLTRGQKVALKEILDDLSEDYPMSRLLQGDVGSGKTVVAAIAALQVVRSGYQVCLMAPTEILAKQHYKTCMEFLQREGMNIQFIAGSTTKKNKGALVNEMKTGRVDMIIGTHALIQEGIGFHKLGLAIIDEQHRFGVKQRAMLRSFGGPHVLNLSATPIPRTLAMTLYGDCDLSIIDEMPPGRQPIITRIVPSEKRSDAEEWITKQLDAGSQAFVICPLISDNANPEEQNQIDLSQIKAATKEFKRLEKVFKKHRVGLLHGKMKQEEKDSAMEKFQAGAIDVLVSTAVVEVGIDVPNATIMVIEGAERFGLAQLHQFRGRVGRGVHQSYCFFFATEETPPAMQRLSSLVKHQSGFRLAEIDLAIRGPGEFFGLKQSGIPDLKMASFGDATLLQRTRQAAQRILEQDQTLEKNPKLLHALTEAWIDYQGN